MCGVKTIDRMTHSNSKNPVYSLPYPRLVSGIYSTTVRCVSMKSEFDLNFFVRLFYF